MHVGEAAAAAADQSARRFYERGGQPGLAYGIVQDGELVHAAGLGERSTGGPVPDADTVFRIASMTKSFTASLIMVLRDEGKLRLDDAAQVYVPELADVRLPAADCGPLTIRQLLTMTAGFPTDDPWGDRQQALPLDAFGRLLAADEVRFCWTPGTRFEYSNLGYAILGRVIAGITGVRYEVAVRDRLLKPLGLARTGFEATEFDPAELACGYRKDGDAWLAIEPEPSGAFAPMGGVFSSVRDLARWVSGFAAAFPARDDAEAAHPLSRASRREMQLPQVAISDGADAPAARLSGNASFSYGFGLFVEDHPAFGQVIQHSGGYPGFGSQMRWHPGTGVGTIVLGNSTYARAGALAGELLSTLLAADSKPAGRRGRFLLQAAAPMPSGPWPETIAARDAANGLLQHWDDAAADQLFSANVALDRPFAERRAEIDLLRDRIGEFQSDPGRPAEHDSPAHCRWWLTGQYGTVAATIRLAPLRKARVEQLVIAVPPGPDSALSAAIDLLITALNEGSRSWPDGLGELANSKNVMRQLRMAGAWAGSCQLAAWLAGDGSSTATVELVGADGRLALTVEQGSLEQKLERVDVTLLSAR